MKSVLWLQKAILSYHSSYHSFQFQFSVLWTKTQVMLASRSSLFRRHAVQWDTYDSSLLRCVGQSDHRFPSAYWQPMSNDVLYVAWFSSRLSVFDRCSLYHFWPAWRTVHKPTHCLVNVPLISTNALTSSCFPLLLSHTKLIIASISGKVNILN